MRHTPEYVRKASFLNRANRQRFAVTSWHRDLSQVDIETGPSKDDGSSYLSHVNLDMGVRPLARFLRWKSKPCCCLLVFTMREFAWKSPEGLPRHSRDTHTHTHIHTHTHTHTSDILQCWEGPVRFFVWSIFLFPLSSHSSNKFNFSPGHDTKTTALAPPSTLRCAMSCASVRRFPLLILIITGLLWVLKPLLVFFHCHSKINVV